jgi:hypothetical protein
MKVEPVDQTEHVLRTERKGSDRLNEEVQPQKSMRELSEKQIRPRQSPQQGMDVIA